MNPIDEEKKKREGSAPSSVSGNVIASPQASMQTPAKPTPAILEGVSVGGSRPAIYDGQPATGNIYAKPAAQAAAQAANPSAAKPSVAAVDTSAGPTTTDSVGNAYTPERGFNPGRAIVDMFKNSAEAARTGVPYSDVVRSKESTALPAEVQAAAQATAPAANAAPQPAIASYSNEGRSVTTPNSNPVTLPPEYPNITPTNLSAANASLANANAIRQSMIDSQSAIDQTKGQSGGIIEDQNKKDREALFAKWDRENMVQKVANMNPRNAAAVAALLGSGDRTAAEQAQTAAVRRGQDFTRESQAANAAVANREVSNRERMTTSIGELQAAQSKGILSGVEKDAQITELQRKAAAGDKAALETLQAMRGKGERSRDRYITMPNRKVYNAMGQVVGEEPGGIFDAETGGMVQQTAKQAQAKPTFDQFAVHIRAKNQGKTVTDDQLKAAFKKQFGE